MPQGIAKRPEVKAAKIAAKLRARWRDPVARALMVMPLEERFWRNVNKNGPTQPHMTTPCWVWMGTTNRFGYGRIADAGRLLFAHRVAFELRYGPMRKGLKACHHCDFKACVRHDHRFACTQRENILDSVRKGGHRNPVMYGAQNTSTKLSDEVVRHLRAAPPSPLEKTELAADLGVTVHTLNRIIQGTRRSGPGAAPIAVHPRKADVAKKRVHVTANASLASAPVVSARL